MNPQTFQLTVKKGPRLRETFELDKDEIIIGRDTTADIVFEIPEVSRKHAIITRRGDEYFVEDNSTNGTFINKKKVVGQYQLQNGDVLMLSDEVYLTFESKYDPGATLVAAPAFTSQAQETEYALPPTPVPPPPPPREQYAGKIPSSPPDMPLDFSEDIPEEGKKKTWLWAGIGCLVVVIFFVVVGLVLFDALNFYCTPPFDKLFSFLYTCP